jgi:DUF4097 and DUF4098 domain-containing protein YvlB
MESRNLTTCIILASVLVLLCACTLALAVGAMGWLAISGTGRIWPLDQGCCDDQAGAGSSERDSIERTFDAGQAPSLKIDQAAGSVTVRPGAEGAIHVVTTKKAPQRRDLDQLQVEMSAGDGGLVIKTWKPAGLNNAWVDLEIMAPADTRLDLHISSGSADVRGLRDVQVDINSGSLTLFDISEKVVAHTDSGKVRISDVAGPLKASTSSGSIEITRVDGEVDAHTGSGSIDLSGAQGKVRLETRSGGIDYQGTPRGDCSFQTSSGGITLLLPADLEMSIDLSTSSGSVDVDYPVAGRTTKRLARGVIGSGDQGSIFARTGSGSIHLIRQ